MLINSPNISGSLTVTGNATITGSLTVAGGINAAITGSATTASYVEYSNVANKPALISGSAQITAFGYATTGSNQFNGSQAVTGSLTVTGQVFAQTLNVQQVTSSIVYSSGSNIFGNTLGNTQQFTGSVSVTGSLTTSIAAFGSAATTFLTSDSGTIKSRTAAQTLSDIAALPLAGGTLTGALNGTSASFSNTLSVANNASNQQVIIEANRGTGASNTCIFEMRNTNATSNKVQVSFGGGTVASGYGRTFSFGVDIGGVGVKDFFVYNGNTTNTPFIITPNDRVIIGNPSISYSDLGYRLDVLGTARVTGAATFSSSVNVGGAGAGSRLNVKGDASNSQLEIGNLANGSNYILSYDRVAITYRNLLITTNASDNALFINTSGNVGIGTTSPTVLSGYTTLSVNNNTNSGIFEVMTNNVPQGRFFANPSNYVGLSAVANIALVFGTNDIERMRIISSGEVGIGVTPTSGNKFWIRGSSTSGADTSLFIQNSTPSSLFLVRNDGLVGFPKINDFTTGNSPNTWINPASSYGIYINTSSRRYKKDIVTYNKGLDIVNQLRPVYYKGISEVDGDKQFVGLIAEEIHDLGLTEFVNYNEEGLPNSLSYPNMIALAFKAIQEQQSQIETLKSKIEILEQS